MIHLNLITVGKLKENYWQEAEKEYLKRLQPWAKISFTEIKEEPFDEKSNLDLIKNIEAKKIINKLSTGINFVLDSQGEKITSNDLAEIIKNSSLKNSTFNFIIGGPLGLDDRIKKIGKKISLSNLTFTHQMARIILLEQLYRSYMINANRRYHY